MFRIRVEYPTDGCDNSDIPEGVDEVIFRVGDVLQKIDNSNKFINIPKVRSIMDAEELLKKSVSEDAKVTHRLHEPWLSCGCITVKGKSITLNPPGVLVEVARNASVVDIAPTSSGAVTIDFTFDNLTMNPGGD